VYPQELPRGGVSVLSLTAVYRKVPEGYIAFVQELAGANSPGCYAFRRAQQPPRGG